MYVAGACLGALIFGQLTDRFGRKRLFTITLGIYVAATVATAFSFAPWYFFLFRFITGMGIGGEYAAINSAIDELIPARVRGRVDLIINGSYWVGAALGCLASILVLDQSIFATNLGWRLAFGVGAVLGLGMILVRRNVPESPRWLFIHGRQDEAERIVDQIETAVTRETGGELEEPRGAIRVRQRESTPFREIARVAFSKYPRRALLGLALFVGQAFLYNAITFDLGTILNGFFKVATGAVPYFVLMFAGGNLLGPLLLGRLFDTVGRKPMIAGTYLVSAVLGVVLGFLLLGGTLDRWSFIAMVGVTFFFASAGASAAYLTVSEIFPMETRALAIAFFYAVGTGIGGITGPLLFGNLINSGQHQRGRNRVLHRRRDHGRGRRDRDLLRDPLRAATARGDRRAAHRRGGGARRGPARAGGGGARARRRPAARAPAARSGAGIGLARHADFLAGGGGRRPRARGRADRSRPARAGGDAPGRTRPRGGRAPVGPRPLRRVAARSAAAGAGAARDTRALRGLSARGDGPARGGREGRLEQRIGRQRGAPKRHPSPPALDGRSRHPAASPGAGSPRQGRTTRAGATVSVGTARPVIRRHLAAPTQWP